MEKADKITLVERELPITRGVVVDDPTRKHLSIRQFVPSQPDLVPWLEHVWMVAWDMPGGQQHMQRTVPFPLFNLVVDQRRGSALFGCTRSYFEYPLQGSGWVVGFRFKSAFQGAFHDGPAVELTDGFAPATSFLAPDILQPLEGVNGRLPTREDIAASLRNLCDVAKPVSDVARRVNQMTAFIEAHGDLFRVADLATEFSLTERTLQRQFEAHLGMTPKAVIERFRIHNTLANCASGEETFSDLALQLGYFDQSHFINAFKRIVGCSPADYAKRLRETDSEG